MNYQHAPRPAAEPNATLAQENRRLRKERDQARKRLAAQKEKDLAQLKGSLNPPARQQRAAPAQRTRQPAVVHHHNTRAADPGADLLRENQRLRQERNQARKQLAAQKEKELAQLKGALDPPARPKVAATAPRTRDPVAVYRPVHKVVETDAAAIARENQRLRKERDQARKWLAVQMDENAKLKRPANPPARQKVTAANQGRGVPVPVHTSSHPHAHRDPGDAEIRRLKKEQEQIKIKLQIARTERELAQLKI
ncbi:hypothetical protein BP6252_09676 [Coleophoma cylindrospora]|uniref:Uncharacterized protein n=1 Tax=Coleophoma cylindrospora TaxID=1849047 RepID=A0A3D8QWH1_9HELO|nr:hypothetical protein BP6252_09676 [Coleophoma cylindrospora]